MQKRSTKQNQPKSGKKESRQVNQVLRKKVTEETEEAGPGKQPAARIGKESHSPRKGRK